MNAMDDTIILSIEEYDDMEFKLDEYKEHEANLRLLNKNLAEGLVKTENQLRLLIEKYDKCTSQLVSYEVTLGFLKDSLADIADEDFRGNRPSGSVKAYQALKKIGAR